MKLRDLTLNNFRNYQDLKLNFNKKIIYLVGLNGQGKTNIAESISVLSLLSSFRTKTYGNLINKESDFFYINGIFEDNRGNSLNIKVSYKGNKKKIVFQDKQVLKFSDLWGKIPLVYLIPDQGIITTGPPSQRRDFLDKMLSLVSKEYFSIFRNYNRVLKQKNNLLQKFKKETKKPFDFIKVYNSQLVEYGEQIFNFRLDFLEKYNIFFREIIQSISSNIKNAAIKYSSSIDRNNFKEDFSNKLSSSLNYEAIRGGSLIGPHKDDISFEINNFNLRNFGSKGQHKIFLVALKLAEIEFIKSITDEYPILILDDLYSEIDNEKCEKVAKLLDRNIQTFITTCDESKIKYFSKENIQVIRVDNAKCYEYDMNGL